jgi:hypothetical protein
MSSTIHGVQVFTLNDTNDYVFKESGDHILENAMYLYHHYYQRTCDLKLIDFTLVPLYKYYQVFDPIADQSDLDKKVSNNFYGGFAQAVLNLGDLWVRTDTLFGSINERFKSKNPLYPDKVEERSYTKFDDITIRAGYDIFFNGDDHWGPYILGSIPVNHEIEGQLQGSLKNNWKDTLKALPQPQPNQNGQAVQAVINDVSFVDILNAEKELTLVIDTPQMGVGNYRVGGGIQGAWTVFDRNEHHIALFGDLQYSYAMSTSLARVIYNDMNLLSEDPNDKNVLVAIKSTLKNSKGLVRLNNPKDGTEIKYTAGSLINMLGIMHYACGDFNLECGCLLSAGFGQKLQKSYRVITDDVNYPDGGAKKQAKSETKVETLTTDKDTNRVTLMVDEVPFKISNQPEIINFRIQPYVALGINTLISDNPFTVGAGVSYEYDHTSSKNKPNALQGLSAWTTVSLSF